MLLKYWKKILAKEMEKEQMLKEEQKCGKARQPWKVEEEALWTEQLAIWEHEWETQPLRV